MPSTWARVREGLLVQVVGAAGDGVEHVPLGAFSAADDALVVGVGVDGLQDAPAGAAPGRDPLVMVIQAGQRVPLALGHGPAPALVFGHRAWASRNAVHAVSETPTAHSWATSAAKSLVISWMTLSAWRASVSLSLECLSGGS